VKRHKRKTGEEVSNWWFSDEDLQEAISHIVDVPAGLRKPRKLAPRNPQENNAQRTIEVTSGTNQN